jgi:hypothetical protein
MHTFPEFPKIAGERVWLTQAVMAEQDPIKLVFLGVPVAVSAVVAKFLNGSEMEFENYEFQTLKRNMTVIYRTSRVRLKNSPYTAIVISSPELTGKMAPRSQLEQLLMVEIKNCGLPFLPEWGACLVPKLKSHLGVLDTLNVEEPMFLLNLPRDTLEVLDQVLMPHLEELKRIAEGGITA